MKHEFSRHILEILLNCPSHHCVLVIQGYSKWLSGFWQLFIHITLQIAVYVFFYLIEQYSKFLLHTLQVLYMCTICDSTGLFKMIVEVLTTCRTQYTSDSSICLFLFNWTILQVFVTYLTGALYVHRLWFYRVIRNDCRGFNNLSYILHLR